MDPNIDLKTLLDLHRKWILGDPDGKRLVLVCKDLSGSNLSGSHLNGSNLSGSNLSCSNLSGCDLRACHLNGSNISESDLSESNLSWCNIIWSNLSGSNLSGSNLIGSNLSGSDLSGSNLSGSDLSGSNLSGSNLSGSDLSGSNLSGSNLSGSNLSGSNLIGSNLSWCDLRGCDLRDTVGLDLALAKSSHLPPTGPLHGWKKCANDSIVKLLIPDGAKRSHGAGRKCRAERAEVLGIFNSDGESIGEAFSIHDPSFVYRVGETVTPRKPWCEDRWEACNSGIHFFITREEAEAYN